MTDGMKSGAGSDPFANDSSDDDTPETKQETSNSQTGKQSNSESDSQTETENLSATSSQDRNAEQGEGGLQYIFARKTVKSDRKMTQYFLREKAQAVEKDAQRVLVGAEHLDEVADELRDWGYRFKED
jgi:hypothetical protein